MKRVLDLHLEAIQLGMLLNLRCSKSINLEAWQELCISFVNRDARKEVVDKQPQLTLKNITCRCT